SVCKPATRSFPVNESPAATEAAENAEKRGPEASSSETGFNLAHAVEAKVGSETATEWVFILISLLVAGAGIGLGLLFYIKSPNLADVWAARLAPLYRASYNKYWIDEFFGWAITRRTMDLARGVFAFDSEVVDGA